MDGITPSPPDEQQQQRPIPPTQTSSTGQPSSSTRPMDGVTATSPAAQSQQQRPATSLPIRGIAPSVPVLGCGDQRRKDEAERLARVQSMQAIPNDQSLPSEQQQQQQSCSPPAAQQKQHPPPVQQQRPSASSLEQEQQQPTPMDIDSSVDSFTKKILASLPNQSRPAPSPMGNNTATNSGTPWKKSKAPLPRMRPQERPDHPPPTASNLWEALPPHLNGALDQFKTDSPEFVALVEWTWARFQVPPTAPRSHAKKPTYSGLPRSNKAGLPGSRWKDKYQRDILKSVGERLSEIEDKNWKVS